MCKARNFIHNFCWFVRISSASCSVFCSSFHDVTEHLLALLSICFAQQPAFHYVVFIVDASYFFDLPGTSRGR